MGRKDKYSLVTDFAWYITILQDLALMIGSDHGREVSNQIIDISVKVDEIRPFVVESMLSLLLNENHMQGQIKTTLSEVLKAAAWVCGEFSTILSFIHNDKDDNMGDAQFDEQKDEDSAYWIEGLYEEEFRSEWRGQFLHKMIIQFLVHPETASYPIHVQVVFLQAIMKIFIRTVLDCETTKIAEIIHILRERLPFFLQVIKEVFFKSYILFLYFLFSVDEVKEFVYI